MRFAATVHAHTVSEAEEGSREGGQREVVLNNYFGIGVDAAVTLAFDTLRRQNPQVN